MGNGPQTLAYPRSWDFGIPWSNFIATENTSLMKTPNGGGLVREMGPRLFQGNRVVGEIL